MTPHDIILLAVKASIVLTVFGVALGAQLSDALYLFKRPKELVRSLLAMSIVMPLVAVALCALFDLNPAVKIALVALAIAPVPPFLPKKQLQSGGTEPYVIGLLTATSLLAVVLAPATIALIGSTFHREIAMPPSATFKIMLTTVLVPLALGILIHAIWPRGAQRMQHPVLIVAGILLVGGLLPVLIKVWPEIDSLIGNGTVMALIAFTAIGLMAGHLLGGPNPDDRTALALATSSRHPAVAIVFAHINYPDQHAALAAVLLALLLSIFLAAPYLHWRKKHGFGVVHGGAS